LSLISEYVTKSSAKRGRGELGFKYRASDTLLLEVDGFYDGIGKSAYEGYGLSLTVEFKF